MTLRGGRAWDGPADARATRLVAQAADGGVIAVDLDGTRHGELNEIFLVVPRVAEVRHDLVNSRGMVLEGLASGASDHPFGVVGPPRAEAIRVATGRGIGVRAIASRMAASSSRRAGEAALCVISIGQSLVRSAQRARFGMTVGNELPLLRGGPCQRRSEMSRVAAVEADGVAPSVDLIRSFHKHSSLGGGIDLIPGYQLIKSNPLA
jgi:hypothetical protein